MSKPQNQNEIVGEKRRITKAKTQKSKTNVRNNSRMIAEDGERMILTSTEGIMEDIVSIHLGLQGTILLNMIAIGLLLLHGNTMMTIIIDMTTDSNIDGVLAVTEEGMTGITMEDAVEVEALVMMTAFIVDAAIALEEATSIHSVVTTAEDAATIAARVHLEDTGDLLLVATQEKEDENTTILDHPAIGVALQKMHVRILRVQKRVAEGLLVKAKTIITSLQKTKKGTIDHGVGIGVEAETGPSMSAKAKEMKIEANEGIQLPVRTKALEKIDHGGGKAREVQRMNLDEVESTIDTIVPGKAIKSVEVVTIRLVIVATAREREGRDAILLEKRGAVGLLSVLPSNKTPVIHQSIKQMKERLLVRTVQALSVMVLTILLTKTHRLLTFIMDFEMTL